MLIIAEHTTTHIPSVLHTHACITTSLLGIQAVKPLLPSPPICASDRERSIPRQARLWREDWNDAVFTSTLAGAICAGGVVRYLYGCQLWPHCVKKAV